MTRKNVESEYGFLDGFVYLKAHGGDLKNLLRTGHVPIAELLIGLSTLFEKRVF